MIGSGAADPSTIANCSNSSGMKGLREVNDTFTTSIYVTWSSSIRGPWPAPVPVVFNGTSPQLGEGRYNPSPHFLDNGGVFLAFNGGPANEAKELPGLSYSPPRPNNSDTPPWVGPFELVGDGKPVFPDHPWCLAGSGEDPFLWQDR